MTLLALLMAERRITNARLANAVGVAPVTISRWRRGAFRPLPAYAEKLESFFKVPAERLASDVIIERGAACPDLSQRPQLD